MTAKSHMWWTADAGVPSFPISASWTGFPSSVLSVPICFSAGKLMDYKDLSPQQVLGIPDILSPLPSISDTYLELFLSQDVPGFQIRSQFPRLHCLFTTETQVPKSMTFTYISCLKVVHGPSWITDLVPPLMSPGNLYFSLLVARIKYIQSANEIYI